MIVTHTFPVSVESGSNGLKRSCGCAAIRRAYRCVVGGEEGPGYVYGCIGTVAEVSATRAARRVARSARPDRCVALCLCGGQPAEHDQARFHGDDANARRYLQAGALACRGICERLEYAGCGGREDYARRASRTRSQISLRRSSNLAAPRSPIRTTSSRVSTPRSPSNRWTRCRRRSTPFSAAMRAQPDNGRGERK